MFFLVRAMIKCLVATIIIEVIVAIILKVRNKKDFLNIILVNCMTNPLVVSIPVTLNILYGVEYRNIAYVLLEIFAVVSEGCVYKRVLKYNKINPYVFSLILNVVSCLIGEIVGRIL